MVLLAELKLKIDISIINKMTAFLLKIVAYRIVMYVSSWRFFVWK